MSSTTSDAAVDSSMLTPDQTSSYLPTVDRCLNCEAPIGGNFCANCGQDATNRNVKFWSLAWEIINDYISFDSKLFRSMKPLLVKPGLLTAAYNAGQRVRYVFPPRLYLIVSVICFFVIANFDPITVEQAKGFYGDGVIEGRLAQAKITNALFAQRYQNAFESALPIWMLFVIPLFALFLKLIYIRSKRYFVEHLVFSFHFFTFVFLSYIPAGIIRLEIFYIPVMLLWFVYLFLAMKRVYQGPIAKTSIKWLLASGAFFTLLIAYLAFVSTWAVEWALR